MARSFAEVLIPFLLPFAAYALFLALRGRYPGMVAAWSRGPLAILVVCGLALAVASLLLAGVFGPRARGTYVPAHIENGTLVPGRMQ